MAADRCLLLYTKPAVPGRVKTRLIGELTAAQAAQLHQAFLDDLVERLAGGRFDLRIAWALAPGEEPPRRRPPGIRQQGGALGERLSRGLAAAGRSYRLVAALGSDHPTVANATVEEAFGELDRGADVVLGPAEDGGYYLLAARRSALVPELFSDLPWSTDRLLAATLERCREQRLATRLLPRGTDVDTPEDLATLAARLTRDGGRQCPRTHRLLASWGRLRPAGPAFAGAVGGGTACGS